MESPLVYLTAVVVLGIAAQALSSRLHIPAILPLLVFGFLFGFAARPEDVLGRDVLFPIVSLSVAVILFEGGLSLRFRDIRETRGVVFRLVIVGALVTWILATWAGRLVFVSPGMAALAGALFVVSGPTVIMPLLRHVRPVRRIESVAKWEGIVNDPVGAVLAVLVFEFVVAGGLREAATAVALVLLKAVAVSVAIGAASAFVLIEVLRRHWIPDYLHNPVLLAIVLAAFTGSNLVQAESGLVTVTLLGVLLANQRTVSIAHLAEFKENLGVLLVSILFILLGSRLTLESVRALGWQGPAYLAVLMVVVRPAATLLATFGSPLNWRERAFLAWLAPRGIVAAAVASVFALELGHRAGEGRVAPALAEEAEQIFVPLTFLVILGTVAIYGLSAAPLARRLRIADPSPQGILFAGADPFARAIAAAVRDEGFPVLMVDTNHENCAAARMAGLRTEQASVLSEFVREEVDLGGIGRLIALTQNDEVNTLAAVEFVELFGRANVFQLAAEMKESVRSEVAPKALRGRYLFHSEATHGRISQRFQRGEVIKATPLTEEFDFKAFREMYGESALVLFVLADRKLTIAAADQPLAPQPGQTVIALVEPNENHVG